MNKVQHKNMIIKAYGIYKFLNVFNMPLMSCFLMTFDS